jgi:hypothetical protein
LTISKDVPENYKDEMSFCANERLTSKAFWGGVAIATLKQTVNYFYSA